jgi:hypothetical protein
MATEPDYVDEMKLPAGKTCASCVHVRRCVALGYTKAESTSCDFWPNKFQPAAITKATATTTT